MLNAVFPLINFIDNILASYLPLVLCKSLWGLVAGTVAMIIYAITSNQKSISTLKLEIRSLRRQMLHPSLEDRSEFTMLAIKNLKASLQLFGKVLGPALLSTLPVLLVAIWLDSYHGYALTGNSTAVPLTVIPVKTNADIDINPPELVWSEMGAILIVPPRTPSKKISISINSQMVYSSDPFSVPTPIITKKKWWHRFLASEAGYIFPDAAIKEIRLDIPRKRVIAGFPPWAADWKLPFFLSVLISTLTVKFVFKVH